MGGAILASGAPRFRTACPEGTVRVGNGDVDDDNVCKAIEAGSGGAAGDAGQQGAGQGGGAQGAAGSGAGSGGGGVGGSGGAGGGGDQFPLQAGLLAVAGEHTCARSQGVVRCWGTNRYGQLGNTINSGQNMAANPAPLVAGGDALSDVRHLAAGANFGCALRGDGRVLCWGNNFSGQLGNSTNDGMNTPNPTPLVVDGSSLGVVSQLAVAANHSCALREDGRVLCWGVNRFGQFGNGTNVGATNPNTTPLLVDNSTLGRATYVALGFAHSCAVRDDGRVLCWGNNGYGQLGNGTNVGTSSANTEPSLVEGVPPLVP